jgi:hypothetical protein
MAKDKAKRGRGRGRPRRYAPGKRPTLTFRVQEEMYEDLVKAAKDNQRSISEEIEARLAVWGDVKKLHAEAKAAVAAARIQAIRQAGFQLVRDAGGNLTTVNVSAEMLLAEADGILRSGFNTAENMDKSPTEIMIKRVVEEAIEEKIEAVLQRHGIVGRKGVA